MSTTLERVRQVLAEQLGIDMEVALPAAKLDEDLNADSLDTVELVMAIEAEFDIEIPDDDCDFKTVEDIVQYVERVKGL